MATHRISMLGPNTIPDASEGVFFAPLSSQLALTNVKATLVIVMKEPAGAGDQGFEGKFQIPQNYVGSETIVIDYILDGAPSTLLVGFGIQFLAVINDETADAAYGTERIVSENPGEVDEDLVEETIDVTAETFAAGDEVFYKFFIDDSVATPYTGNVLLTGLYFQYADA